MRLLPVLAAGVAAGFAGQRLLPGAWGFLVAILLVPAGLALVWWLRGGRGWRIEEEATVPAPPETVFPLLDDPRHAPALDPRCTGGRVVGGEGVGRRDLLTVRVGRREVEIESEVVEHDPPRRATADVVATRVDGRPAEAGTQRLAFALEPAPDGTRVRLSIRGAPGGARSRMAIGVRHPGERRQARATLRRLRSLVAAP